MEHIEEVTDFNLLSNHILCFIHAMLSIDKDIKQEAVEQQNSQPHESAVKPSSSMKSEYYHLSGATKLSAMMRDTLSDSGKSKMSMTEIKEKFGKEFSEADIKTYLEELEEQGNIIYTSSNSQRFYEFT